MSLAQLPGVRIVRHYRRADLRNDLVAGVVLTGLLIPAGMGYAEASGLPAVTGLYATIASLLAYALTGPSRVLVLGPDSSLAPLIAAAILPLANGSTDRAVSLAGLLAILVGAVLVGGAIARLGLVMDLVSKPIRIGYLNGIALVIMVSQLPKVLGITIDADGVFAELGEIFDAIVDGDVDGTALAIGVGSLILILATRRLTPRVPGLLVAVVAATVVVWAGDLDVSVVGAMPSGLPSPALDALEWGDVTSLLPAAFAIALVAFTDTGVLSRAVALRDRERVDENHEMGAVGVSNIACGLLGGFAVSASSSRTPVAMESGSRTQLTGVVGAVLVAVLLLAAPGVTTYLPSASLGAVVIVAASALVSITGVTRLWPMSRTEFSLSVVAFAGVALLGVLEGIAVAVGLSLLAFVFKAWRPYMTRLVRVDRRKGYHDVSRHPEGRQIPGLVIVRFDAPLFFANGATLNEFVMGLVEGSDETVQRVVLAAEPITDIDTTAADDLVELDDALANAGIRLVFAEMKGPVKDRLARYGLERRFGADRQYPTVGSAVSAYVRETGTEWVDWQDRPQDSDGSA